MLAVPKYGWNNINIGSFSDRASYLTNVPMDCLKNMIIALENNIDFCIDFDAEGWDFKVISDNYNTYIINSKESIELYTEDINIYKLAKEIHDDIFNNLNDWLSWYFEENELEEIENYKNELNLLLDKLKKLLNKREH